MWAASHYPGEQGSASWALLYTLQQIPQIRQKYWEKPSRDLEAFSLGFFSKGYHSVSSSMLPHQAQHLSSRAVSRQEPLPATRAEPCTAPSLPAHPGTGGLGRAYGRAALPGEDEGLQHRPAEQPFSVGPTALPLMWCRGCRKRGSNPSLLWHFSTYRSYCHP